MGSAQPRQPKMPTASGLANKMVMDYVAALLKNQGTTTETLLPDGRVSARFLRPICLTPEEFLILTTGRYSIFDEDDPEPKDGNQILEDEFGRCTGFEGPLSDWHYYLCEHELLVDVMERFMDCAVRQYDAGVASRRKR